MVTQSEFIKRLQEAVRKESGNEISEEEAHGLIEASVSFIREITQDCGPKKLFEVFKTTSYDKKKI